MNLYLEIIKIKKIFFFQIVKEANIMNHFINHPNLANKVDFFIEKTNKTAYLVLKKVKGVDLFKYII